MNHFCFGGNGAGLTGGRGMVNWSLLVSALDGAGFGLFIVSPSFGMEGYCGIKFISKYCTGSSRICRRGSLQADERQCTKGKLNNEVLAYFLFAAAAWLLALVLSNICLLLGIQLSEMMRVACAIIFAGALGMLWPVWLRDKAVVLANIINQRFGKNPIFVEETILEKVGCDNRLITMKSIKQVILLLPVGASTF